MCREAVSGIDSKIGHKIKSSVLVGIDALFTHVQPNAFPLKKYDTILIGPTPLSKPPPNQPLPSR